MKTDGLCNSGLVLLLTLGLSSCAQPPAVWEAPSLMAPDPRESDESFSPVGINEAGEAWLVWVQNQDHPRLFARSRPAGENWRPAVEIGSGVEEALHPILTVDPAGNARLFWTEWNGRSARPYVSRYEKESGWSTPTEIRGTSALRNIYVDRNGNLLQIRDRTEGRAGGRLIQVITGEEIKIDLPAAPRKMLGLQFEAREDGTIMAAWSQSDDTQEGTRYRVWAAQFRPQSGWAAPKIISEKERDAIEPRLAVARSGVTTFVWRQFDGEFYAIFASRFEPETGWDPPTRISVATGEEAVYPDLAMNARGNVFVVWVQRRCVERHCPSSNVWGRPFQAEPGWGKTFKIAEGGDAAQVAVDGDGNALVVGSRATGSLFKKSEIWARRYSMSEGWSDLIQVESNWANTGHPSLSMNSKGEAIVGWEQYSLGRRTIWATQFHPQRK